MKRVNGLFFPKDDVHFDLPAKRGFYQKAVYYLSLDLVSRWGTAIDIGAHVGFFASEMGKQFESVFAFEPNQENYHCLRMNVPNNVFCIPQAIGGMNGACSLTNPLTTNSGAWKTVKGNDISVTRLDDWSFDDVGLVKIDTQGDELKVLRGAEKTLRQHHPVVICETGDGVEAALEDLGMNIRVILNKDIVASFKTIWSQEGTL